MTRLRETANECCEACRFLGRSEHWHTMGLRSGPACRRSAPIIGDNGTAEWPLVAIDDWCGDYEPRGGESA